MLQRQMLVLAEGESEPFEALDGELRPSRGPGEYRAEDRSVIPWRTYRYRLEVVHDGNSGWEGPVRVTLPAPLPAKFALHANLPNPFSRLTTLRFVLPRSEHVRLEVFDLQGRRVSTLADGRFEAGEHGIEWDGRGAQGALLSAGVYVAHIQAGEFRARTTMVLLS